MTLFFILGAALVFLAIVLVSVAFGTTASGQTVTGVERSVALVQALSSAPRELTKEYDEPFADRILALDLLTTLGAGIIGVFAIRSGEYLFVDVAVALVVISFVSTAAFARYLLSRSEK